ncbi:LOW QUALITY PROTEIN: prolyl 3-hydroxylase 1 [Electrophorus electricus]|uniref:LOW QUALITY PROTEIN: prolyl 3-hydroxylase 1 n=1 Tax=Electrophorus electricus TaxID=8005 RepID=UPI0015D01113|nr:LOW QUALITY PROTEIN: prolyl 3-hydroxylase 1 [Electrophorus electricus]
MRAASILVILTLSVLDDALCDPQISGVLEPYDLLFDNAVESYYKQDWLSVILNMERALLNKGTVSTVRTRCRLSCADQSNVGEPVPGVGVPVPGAGPLEDLGFFQRLLKRAECVTACETEKLGPLSLHKVSDEVELEFRKRTPYNYLQVAYFKINKLDKAVAAANTFYVANPDHMEMRQNLEYYSLMAGVQEKDFKDLEAQPHMEEFLEAKRLYSAEDFASAAQHFEAALEEYFSADEECRVLCEGAYDYDGYNYMEYKVDLFQAITDHYLHVLHCKQSCSVQLATVAGTEKPLDDFLPSLLNYLQFSFYNSEKHEKAIEYAKTYLLFFPDDEVMKQNLAYYSAMLGEEKAVSVPPRGEVQKYIKRSLLEKELLYFGYEFFGIVFVDPDTWTPEEIMPQKLRDKQKIDKETAARITEEIGNLMKEIETLVEEKTKESTDIAKIVNDGTSPSASALAGNLALNGTAVSMTTEALNGSQRVVLDGILTDDECGELHRLSNTVVHVGDGYRAKPNPHSAREMFQEVSLLQALQLGQDGTLPWKSARLFFDLSEKVRGAVASYFSLETPLYFSSSHLVCRSVVHEKQEEQENGSDPVRDPVHADNCLLISELNECIKDLPTYSHPDYSAILYLNDDFEGGEFIFSELDGKTVTATVRPQCGRVVAFGPAKDNPHGVRAVTKGQRCAVALWFTLDARFNEKEDVQTQEHLRKLSSIVSTDVQEAAQTSSGDTPSEPVTTPEPGRAETPTEEQTTTPAQEQASQTAEQHHDGPAHTNSGLNKDEQSKAKAAPKAKAKTSSDKTKAKTSSDNKAKTSSDKTKAKTSSDKAKAKTSDKTKAKTSDKIKAKTSDKIKAKTSEKKREVSHKEDRKCIVKTNCGWHRKQTA